MRVRKPFVVQHSWHVLRCTTETPVADSGSAPAHSPITARSPRTAHSPMTAKSPITAHSPITAPMERLQSPTPPLKDGTDIEAGIHATAHASARPVNQVRQK